VGESTRDKGAAEKKVSVRERGSCSPTRSLEKKSIRRKGSEKSRGQIAWPGEKKGGASAGKEKKNNGA